MKIVFLFIIVLCSGLVIGYTSESMSYTTKSFHIGISGDSSSSDNLDSRFTLTYEQASNDECSSYSLYNNLGWFENMFIEQVGEAGNGTIVRNRCLFPFIWRVNRDIRRTRVFYNC